MKKLLSLFTVIVLFFFFSSCGENSKNADNQQDTVVSVQIAKNVHDILKFDVGFANYVINSQNGDQITTDRGTVIDIPASAFVDENGNDVTGDIDVKFREITTPADIISSDVDMAYDSAGVANDFQTAGMFEIRAFSGDKELKLKSGKEISVDFASTNPGTYNFYKYDDNNDNWDYKTTSTWLEEPPQVQNNYSALKPVELDPLNDYVIQIDVSQNFSELSMYNGILWKYVGDKTPDEVGKIVNQRFVSNNLRKDNGKYILELKKSNQQIYELEVKPVFSKANFNAALAQYNTAINSNIAINPSTPMRSTKISDMGLYNYDILYHRCTAISLVANFEVNGQPIDEMILFQITNDDRSVIKNSISDNFDFMYEPSWSNKIIGLLPSGEVVYLKDEDFGRQVSTMNGEGTFSLMASDKNIASVSELDDLISTL